MAEEKEIKKVEKKKEEVKPTVTPGIREGKKAKYQ